MSCRDWPATLAQASYKGVGFEVDGDARSTGRRVITHEYPSAENWDNEDLGRKANTINVTAYVYGDDADGQSQTLLMACSLPGPGLLVLPARAPVMARCLSAVSTFSKDTLGRMAFDMEFAVEAAAMGGRVVLSLLAGSALAAIDAAMQRVARHFDARFNSVLRRSPTAKRVPALARRHAARVIRDVGAAVFAARQKIAAADPVAATSVTRLARRMIERADAFAVQGQQSNRDEAAAFVTAQVEVLSPFAQELTEALSALARLTAEPGEAAVALQPMTLFVPAAPVNSVDADSVRAERGLGDEVGAFVRRASLLVQARLVASTPLPSRRAGIAARAAIAQNFEVEIAAAEDDEVAEALVEARNAVTSYLAKASAQRPTRAIETRKPLPAVVLATTLYNDPARDAELMDRNHAPHPHFMPVTLEAELI